MESTRPVNRAICHEFTRPARAPITAATAVRSSTITPSVTDDQPRAPRRGTADVVRAGVGAGAGREDGLYGDFSGFRPPRQRQLRVPKITTKQPTLFAGNALGQANRAEAGRRRRCAGVHVGEARSRSSGRTMPSGWALRRYHRLLRIAGRLARPDSSTESGLADRSVPEALKKDGTFAGPSLG